jgi:hypothetical protein
MPGFRDEDYEDPVNGCINRHTASGAAAAPLVKTSF